MSKIGIKAADVITETKIKGSKFLGELKFNKNIPIPIVPYKITIYIDRILPLFLLLDRSFNQLSATV